MTAETNALVYKLFDFQNYSVGKFDLGIFAEQSQIMNLKLMEEVDKCGYTKYLIALDTMTNNLPQLIASASNLATQIGTGFSKQDTSIYLSFDKFEACYNENWNWEKCGGGLQLAMSQLLKISAEEASITVTPTNAS